MWDELSNIKKEYQKLDFENVLNYEKLNTISIIWHSAKIENCSLNETDARELIENDITANNKPLHDHLMIKDLYKAYQFIKDQAKIKRKIDVAFIKEIAAKVMADTGEITNTSLGSFDTSKGDLRLTQVYADKKYFPDFKKVPMLLERLCDRVNERLDKAKNEDVIKLAADIQFNFINIHPFGSGNEITARLLMNYIQLHQNDVPIKIFSEDKAEYIRSLNETEEKNDPEILRYFIINQHIKFFKAEIDKYQKLNKDFPLLF